MWLKYLPNAGRMLQVYFDIKCCLPCLMTLTAVKFQEHIVWFEVSVSDALLAQVIHPFQQLQQHERCLHPVRHTPPQVLAQAAWVTTAQTHQSWLYRFKNDHKQHSAENESKGLFFVCLCHVYILFFTGCFHDSSLLHDQEQCAIAAQTQWIESGRQDIRVLLLSSRQQRDLSSEGPVHCDHVGMSGQLFRHRSKVAVKIAKPLAMIQSILRPCCKAKVYKWTHPSKAISPCSFVKASGHAGTNSIDIERRMASLDEPAYEQYHMFIRKRTLEFFGILYVVYAFYTRS